MVGLESSKYFSFSNQSTTGYAIKIEPKRCQPTHWLLPPTLVLGLQAVKGFGSGRYKQAGMNKKSKLVKCQLLSVRQLRSGIVWHLLGLFISFIPAPYPNGWHGTLAQLGLAMYKWLHFVSLRLSPSAKTLTTAKFHINSDTADSGHISNTSTYCYKL